jgi:hypothetical protein
MANEEFNKKLLESQNPFPYPQPPDRPSFFVGGEPYLKWFEDTYNNTTKQEGTSGVFIVGMPGAGKTRFLRYLDYLFYETNEFKGIYATKTLSDQELDERELWKEVFLSPDSASRLASLVPKEKISSAEIRPDIKANLLKLIDQSLDMDSPSLTIEAIRGMAKHISNLLPDESVMCVALDNIEEYLSAREKEYLIRAKTTPEETTTKRRATADAVDLLVGKIRTMTSDLRRAIVVLALTDSAWGEVKATEPARTKGRRFKFAEEEQVLAQLTLGQSYQLVHEYMKLWSTKNGLTLPAEYKECMCSIGTENVSIYPFTPLSIELARKITDQLAGDITCFCSECINRMRSKRQIELVRDEFAFENLSRISKEYTWLGWAPRAKDVLEEMGPIIREKHLVDKLKELAEKVSKRYDAGMGTEAVSNSIDRFADVLGITISTSPTVENSYNPGAKPVKCGPLLKIWSFGDTKIAVRYVIGERASHHPNVRMIGGRASFQDYIDVMSLVDGGKATHGLLVLLWAADSSSLRGSGLHRTLREFGNTITTVDISDEFDKMVAVAEATEEQKDLARFVDKIFLHLTDRLAALIQQKKPVSPPIAEYKTEKLTRGE